MDLARAVLSLGGLAATHELYARGATRWMLSVAVRDGALDRIRQGWYCVPGTNGLLVRAARVGGTLGCVSALKGRGMWIRGKPPLHVVVPRNAARLRTEHNARERLCGSVDATTVIHWSSTTERRPQLTRPVIDCLLDMASCASPERTVAATDSAIRHRLVTEAEWQQAIVELPSSLRALLAEATGMVESITESVFQFRMRRLGLRPRCQVGIPSVGRVDFVFGSRLIVEVDGWEYHGDRTRFEADRRRDARLSALGYRVLRFSYRQVFENWHEVRAAVLAAIARGDHR